MRWVRASTLAGFLLVTLSLLLTPAYGFVGPRFVDLRGGYEVASASSDYNDNVCIAVRKAGTVLLYQHGSGKLIEVSIGHEAGFVAMYGGYCVAYQKQGRLLTVINVETLGAGEVEVEQPIEYVTYSQRGIFYLVSPVAGVVYSLDPKAAAITGVQRIDVASGRGLVSVYEEKLWAILGDYRTVAVVDLETGERSEYKLDGEATSILALSDSEAWVTRGGGVDILRLGQGVTGRIELDEEGPLVVEPPVVQENGWVTYVSPSRRRLWTIEAGEVIQVNKLRDFRPLSPSAGGGFRLWLVDGTTGRLAYVSLGRDPSIEDWSITPRKDGEVSVFLKVSDPDNDLDPSGIRVRFLQYDSKGILIGNTTVEAKASGDGYEAVFKPFDRAADLVVYGIAEDMEGNIMRAQLGRVDLEALREEEGEETVVLNTATTPQIADSGIITLLLSGMLLLLPMIMAALFFATRKRRSRRRR